MTRHCLLAALLLPVFALAAEAAPPTDVAELFPPGTLAYAELNGPGELGPQLGALFKGTPLEDSIPFIHGKKGEPKPPPNIPGRRQLAELALLVSPEVLADFRKLGGVAVALVDYNPRGQPEVAIAVLTGESNAAGLAARSFVTTTPNLRKVAEVSKVPVFQYKLPNAEFVPGGPQPPPMPKAGKGGEEKLPREGPYERTFAYTQGLFVAGTSKAAIAPIIKRFAGEEKESLRTAARFKEAAAEYRKPGLFFYADAPALFAKLDAAGRAREEMMDSDWLAWLRIVAGPKALKWVAGRAHFRDGGLALTTSLKLDGAQKSPLAEFLSGTAVKADGLHHARRPAAFAFTVSLPEKNRAAALLGLLDAVATSGGEIGRLPGDIVKDLEEKQKLAVRDTLLAKLRAVTVVVPAKQELPKGALAMPMLVLHFDDAAAAGAWEEFLPKLAGEVAGGKPARPSSETVNGVKVLSLPATGLPWKSPVHYARSGAAVVVGQDRKLVAGAASADPKSSVVSGDKPPTLPAGDFALVGTLNLGDALGLIELPATTDAPRWFDPFPRIHKGNWLPPDDKLKDADAARAAFLAAFNQLPPATVTARRTGDELKLELFQPKVQNGGLTPVINASVKWVEKLLSLQNPNGGYPYSERPIYGEKW